MIKESEIKKRVIFLPRVSSKKQAKQGDSIDTQINRLNEHSEKNGDKVVGIYTDAGKSASISDDNITIQFKDGRFIVGLDLNKRAGLKRALNEIDKDLWDGAKFTKWDRLSRNNVVSKILQIYFERHNKKLIPVDDSNEPLLIGIKNVLGQEEINKMKDRVKEVREYRFNLGLFPSRSPFGYRTIIKDKKVIGFKPHPKESQIIKEVFKLVSEGISYKEICKQYNLKPQSCYNIIKNKAYIGLIEFEGKVRKGKHTPLITKELFEKCQKK